MGYGKKDVIEADGSMVIRYGDVISEMEYGNMAKVSALVEPFIYYGKNEAGEEIPCGIDLSDSYFCEKTGIDMNPCYLGIVNNTARIDTVISWIDFALEGE